MEIQLSRLTPGSEAQMLVPEPQSELQGFSAAPPPTASFHTWGIQRPREGEQLARGHTAFSQQTIKYLLCQALCLGLETLNNEQNSHKLKSRRDYTLLQKWAKSR